jgi:acetoin utilization protein AcuB
MELCTEKRIRHLPILDDNKQLAGLITDRDIRFHLSPRLGTISENKSDRESLERPIHLIMTRSVIVASEKTSLEEAAQLMLADRLGCLPVVNSDGRVVGIVTAIDFVGYIARGGN